MPQYLAPGVYVEEIPGPETIQAVGTQTAGFIGPCRFGPTSGRPQLLTSFLDFQRIYGDWTDLEFTDTDQRQLHGPRREGLLSIWKAGPPVTCARTSTSANPSNPAS